MPIWTIRIVTCLTLLGVLERPAWQSRQPKRALIVIPMAFFVPLAAEQQPGNHTGDVCLHSV
jgi:hypothetical protein